MCFEKFQIVVFDNTRTHSSTMTKRTIKRLDIWVWFFLLPTDWRQPSRENIQKDKFLIDIFGGTLNIDFNNRRRVDIISGLICSLINKSWKVLGSKLSKMERNLYLNRKWKGHGKLNLIKILIRATFISIFDSIKNRS